MPPATRLDPLLKLKEREQQRRLVDLSNATRALQAAQQRVEDLRRAAARSDLQSGPVELWMLREESHQRALRELQRAREAVTATDKACQVARAAFLTAKRTVETFRKATERKRAEIVREIERSEQKTLEEMAALLAHR
jgi:flagellar export protein FliJ